MNKFDSLLIKLVKWVFTKRKMTIIIQKKDEHVSPNSKLCIISNGNIGI